jgi:hypothetical protein
VSDTYRVEVEIACHNDLENKVFGAGGSSGFASKVGTAHSSLAALNGTLQGIGRGVMAPFDAVAHKAFDIGSALAKIGVAGGAGLTTYGLKINQELESATLAFGALFNAAGMVKNIDAGMEKASGFMAKMRTDASVLPGEFQDLATIARTIATPAFQAGASIDKLESLSAKVMSAAATLGIAQDQAAREGAMALEGRAGSHNVLSTRLGIHAQGFNELDPAKRMARFEAELDRFAPAIAKQAHSMDAVFSTFRDSGKKFLSDATLPLFQNIKSAFVDVNGWLEKNDAFVNSKAQAWGSKLSWAFEEGKRITLEWGPLLVDFVDHAADRMSAMWTAAQPFVDKLAPIVKDFLKDPKAFDKIVGAAETYGAVKVGGSVLGGAADVGIGAMGIMSTLKMLGVGGGGAATAAAGAGAVGTAGATGSAGLLSGFTASSAAAEAELAGLAGASTTSAAAFTGLFATVGSVGLALGGVSLAAWQAYELYNDIASDEAKTRDSRVRSMDSIFEEAKRTAQFVDEAGTHYQNMMQAMIASGDELGVNLMWTATAAANAAAALDEVGKRGTSKNASLGEYWGSVLSAGVQQAVTESLASKGAGDKAKTPKHGGGGGTHITGPITITIAGSSDPSRIARSVLAELEAVRRHPKVSRDVPNYSAP